MQARLQVTCDSVTALSLPFYVCACVCVIYLFITVTLSQTTKTLDKYRDQTVTAYPDRFLSCCHSIQATALEPTIYAAFKAVSATPVSMRLPIASLSNPTASQATVYATFRASLRNPLSMRVKTGPSQRIASMQVPREVAFATSVNFQKLG